MKNLRFVLVIATLAFGAWACGEDTEDPENQEPAKGTIAGTVIDGESAAALEGATVTTLPATVTATTGADGTYALADVAPATYEVIVEKAGFETKRRAGVVVAAGATVTLDFALDTESIVPTKGAIAGTVLDDLGAAIAGAAVVTDPPTATATTGDDGTYELLDVEPGVYTVTAGHDGFEVAAGVEVTVVAGETATADFELVPVVEVGSAAITVTDGCTAAPLAGAILSRAGAADVTADAMGVARLVDVAPGDYTFAVNARAMLPGEVTVTVVAGEEATATVELTCQFRAVAALARDFLTSMGPPTIAAGGTGSLFEKLNDGEPANDPVVISVRSNGDYQKGHIGGAINIPWKNVANDDALALLGDPDPAKKYVDYCYTGHTGGIAQGVLGTLGYSIQNMKFGMVSWTQNQEVRGNNMFPFNPATDCINGSTETTAHDRPADQEFPELAFDVTTAREAAIQGARAYLAAAAATISAADLNAALATPETTDDPVIVSVRSKAHYDLGHIPGAINIPYKEIANEENLKKLPKDKLIVVYCYTGHTGGIAAGILGTLGYQVKNLKWGIHSWTQEEAVWGGVKQIQPNELNDFATVSGPNP